MCLCSSKNRLLAHKHLGLRSCERSARHLQRQRMARVHDKDTLHAVAVERSSGLEVTGH